ncbi:MAG: helix-turn-helix transcriptional regulator [Methylomicrobium sp.]|nr:helix-turn-helix transcriptional regulator [Methylomicrobium sp.]
MNLTSNEIRKLNLLLLIDEIGKKSDLAKIADTDPAYISQILSQKNPRNIGDDLARKLEKGCRKPRGWMDAYHDKTPTKQTLPLQPTDSHALPRAQIIEWESPEDLPDGEYVIVPRFRLKLSAGNGNYITEELPDAPLAFTTEWIKKKGVRRSELCIVNATGDSMEPSICDGALLLVDTHSKQVTDGKVYALRYGDELRVKRLYRRYDGGLIIRSDNQAKYPDEALAPSDMNDHIYVIGRVIWQAADL